MSGPIQPVDPALEAPVPDETILWRRIPPDKVTPDANQGRLRPSSDCFTDNLKDGSSMSVFDSLACAGLDQVLKGHENFLVAAITAGQVRAEGLEVVRTIDGGPGHCEVVGKKTSGIKSRLAKLSVWVKAPIGP
jgi:hypothetical protein